MQMQVKQAVQSVVCQRGADSTINAFCLIPRSRARLLLRSLLCGVLFLALAAPASAAQVRLAWNAVKDAGLSGYKLHYGNGSKRYSAKVKVGNRTAYTLSGLTAGRTYYFAVTAYDKNGKESTYSKELAVYVPKAKSMSAGQQASHPSAGGTAVIPHDPAAEEKAEGERVVLSPLPSAVMNSLPSDTTSSLIPGDGSGKDALVSPTEETLYDFAVPQDGVYVMWGLVRAETDNLSFLVTVNFNDEAAIVWESSEETHGSAGLWNRVHDRTLGGPVLFYLPAGVHTFSINQSGDKVMLKEVLLTNDLDYHPAVDVAP